MALRRLIAGFILFSGLNVAVKVLVAQGPAASTPAVDSDQDGLSDALEQALLVQFAPSFMVGEKDCSNIPAEFLRDSVVPSIAHEDGTIYGQAFPAKLSGVNMPMVELHFYHLWKTDCGEHGHPLDAEHVAALVRRTEDDSAFGRWEAVYWYAAAHENTVCDVSQIARASTLRAVERGAKVWISPDKHASYLNETLCQRGCGADRCASMTPLAVARIVNLGEVEHPMNGSTFIGSSAWPLAAKMVTTNFPGEPVARLDAMPVTDIAWFNRGRHPAQGVIAISAATGGAIANGGENTSSAIATGGANTNAAISVAADSTGNALQKSYRKTKHALGVSVRSIGEALHVTPKTGEREE
jgi:hypothetical protein